MAGKLTDDKKAYTDEQSKRVLLKALRGRGGQLTKADAVALSGLSVFQAEQALTSLLKEYRSHLAATESGELIYQFDPAFERRDAVPLRERLTKLGRALWKGFTFLFKVSIMVTLVAYFLIFLAMLLAIIFGRRSSDDRDSGDGMDFGWPLFWMWGWGPSPRYRQRRRGPPGKPLYKKVFDFVFGPPRPPEDPLAQEKEILTYIRQQRGRIAPVDLVKLMGWDFQHAEEQATRLLVDYGGEPEATDEGVVLYVFKDIRKTAQLSESDRRQPRPRPSWERMESRPLLTANTPATNVAISLFNGFNLLAPFLIVPAFEARLQHPIGHAFALHSFPLVFSTLFFAIPLGRVLVEKARDRGRLERNARREILRVAIERRGAPLPPEQLAPDPATAKVLDRSLVALGGDVVTDPEGRIRYAFPRIKEELDAVARARSAVTAGEEDAGAVVFSSKDN
jgi:hypothetical protein